ncbi:hypothetical protein K170097C1_27380 [Hungatella effluvii]
MWENDVEASPCKDKWNGRISDSAFHEKYGYMEIRAEVLWKIVVEDWLDHAVFFCFDSDSVLSGK